MHEDVRVWRAASEDEVLATVGLVRANIDGMVLVAGSPARWSLWNVADEQPLACVQAPYAVLLQEHMPAP